MKHKKNALHRRLMIPVQGKVVNITDFREINFNTNPQHFEHLGFPWLPVASSEVQK
jgi:hypothetical protein